MFVPCHSLMPFHYQYKLRAKQPGIVPRFGTHRMKLPDCVLFWYRPRPLLMGQHRCLRRCPGEPSLCRHPLNYLPMGQRRWLHCCATRGRAGDRGAPAAVSTPLVPIAVCWTRDVTSPSLPGGTSYRSWTCPLPEPSLTLLPVVDLRFAFGMFII